MDINNIKQGMQNAGNMAMPGYRSTYGNQAQILTPAPGYQIPHMLGQ